MTRNIEDYIPVVAEAGLNTDKAVDFDSTLNVEGVATFQAAPVFSAGTTTSAVTVADGAAYTVLAANSGKLHLIANQGQDATLTLPTAAAGLQYEFWHTMVAADGHDWIFDTGSDTNFFLGGLIFADSDVGGAASEVITSAGDGDSNSKLQVNLPSTGTWIKMYCDGTNWYINGIVLSTTAPAFSDQ